MDIITGETSHGIRVAHKYKTHGPWSKNRKNRGKTFHTILFFFMLKTEEEMLVIVPEYFEKEKETEEDEEEEEEDVKGEGEEEEEDLIEHLQVIE